MSIRLLLFLGGLAIGIYRAARFRLVSPNSPVQNGRNCQMARIYKTDHMKTCVYCGGEIPDIAKKCSLCQSFQNPLDEPKRPTDIATLVIKFVGCVAIGVSVVAGLLGFLGVTSTSEINDRANKLVDQTNAIIAKTEAEMKLIDERIDKLSKAENTFNKTQLDLNALSIRLAYARFDEIMESLSISEMYKTPGLLNELQQISQSVSNINPIADESEAQTNRREITSVITCVTACHEDRFDDAVKAIATTVPDDSIRKHRLLVAAYMGLYGQATEENDVQTAAAMLDKAILEASTAMKSKRSTSRQLGDAEINLALTLIFRGASDDLDNAFKYLMDAKKYTPRLSIVAYDLARLYVKEHKVDDAMTCLEDAKVHGDFSVKGDIDNFMDDPNFKELRESPAHQDRLKLLLQITP
jgi:tetratricopeptide (TPR) repeat protein